jgi:hypothetical protein
MRKFTNPRVPIFKSTVDVFSIFAKMPRKRQNKRMRQQKKRRQKRNKF